MAGAVSAAGVRPHQTPAATWSAWDNTIGFWRRRMVHEIAIHLLDVINAVGATPDWRVPAEVALDGIDEVLRLFLVSRLGYGAGASGGVVTIECGGRRWEIGLNHSVEVHSLPMPPPADAVITGNPVAVYAWLWNRRPSTDAGDVAVSGDPAVLADLKRCLALATG